MAAADFPPSAAGHSANATANGAHATTRPDCVGRSANRRAFQGCTVASAAGTSNAGAGD